MNGFIEVTGCECWTTFLIATKHIVSVYEAEDGTMINVVGDDEGYCVRETYDEVKKLIRLADTP